MNKEYEEKLYKILDDLGIKYQKIEHPPFATCEASGNFYQENQMGMDCKNMFLRNKRGRKHYLLVLRADKRLDIPHLAEFLGEHRKMGFASEERLAKYLGLTPGSVTPLSIIYPGAREIPLVLDKDILQAEYLHFHPFRNTASLKMKTDDFLRFCDKYAAEVLFYDTKKGEGDTESGGNSN